MSDTKDILYYNVLPEYRAFDLKADEYLEKPFYIGNAGSVFTTYIDRDHFIDDFAICESNEKIDFERSVGVKDHTPWRDLSQEERENWLDSGRASERWQGHELFVGDIVTYRAFDMDECEGRVSLMITFAIKDDIPILFQLQSICELNDTLVRTGNIHTTSIPCYKRPDLYNKST